MKIFTSLKRDLATPSACGRHPFKKLKGNLSCSLSLTVLWSYALTLFILSAFCLLPSALNAQVGEMNSSDADIVKKIEKIMPPEITEMVLTPIKNWPESLYSDYYGIKNRSQLENLHPGKPIPEYVIDHDTLQLSGWQLPLMCNGEPLLLATVVRTLRGGYGGYVFTGGGEPGMAERIHNYKYKDSIVGILEQRYPQMTCLIVRKEHKVFFVEVYDKATGEYFKNEYSFSEINSLIKDILQKKRTPRAIFSIDSLPKNELILTPEITKMLVTQAYSNHINDSDKELSNWGIKDRSQLENLHLGKPIPMYSIDFDNEKLKFYGYWQMIVMSNDEPLLITSVKLEDDGQYSWAGTGGGATAKIIHNYEHKDLIIGSIKVFSPGPGFSYLIINKDNKNILVEGYDYATREYLKNEYSLSEVIKQIKK